VSVLSVPVIGVSNIIYQYTILDVFVYSSSTHRVESLVRRLHRENLQREQYSCGFLSEQIHDPDSALTSEVLGWLVRRE
jgi:hypothetical protein